MFNAPNNNEAFDRKSHVGTPKAAAPSKQEGGGMIRSKEKMVREHEKV